MLSVMIVKAWSSLEKLTVASSIASSRYFSLRIRIIRNGYALLLLCPVAMEPSNFSIDCVRDVVLVQVFLFLVKLAPVSLVVSSPDMADVVYLLTRILSSVLLSYHNCRVVVQERSPGS